MYICVCLGIEWKVRGMVDVRHGSIGPLILILILILMPTEAYSDFEVHSFSVHTYSCYTTTDLPSVQDVCES